jgi:hypothetical protein
MQTGMRQSVSFQREKRLKEGGAIVYLGAVILILAPFFSLLMLQALVSAEAGRSVSWGEMMDAMAGTSLGEILCMGVFIIIALGFAAIAAGYYMRKGSDLSSPTRPAVAAIVMGVLGTFLSVLIVGGLVGLIGGIMVAVGGGMGLSST